MIDKKHDDIIIQVSDSIFGGFRFKIERSLAISLPTDLLIKKLKKNMKLFFIDNNLLELVDKIDNLQLHFHIFNLYSPFSLFYICSC
jgi:hypothetical protein